MSFSQENVDETKLEGSKIYFFNREGAGLQALLRNSNHGEYLRISREKDKLIQEL